MTIVPLVRVSPAAAARVRAAADTLSDAGVEGVSQALRSLSSYIAAPSHDEELEVMQEGLESQPLKTDQFLAVLAAGISLAELTSGLPTTFSKSQWLDAVRQNVTLTDLTPELQTICENVFEQRDVLNAALSERMAIRGVAPSFDSLRSTVELRAVFVAANAERRPGLPPTRFIPIATLTLWLDSGTPESISFQANRHQMSRLISDLQAVLDQVDLAAEAVSGLSLGG